MKKFILILFAFIPLASLAQFSTNDNNYKRGMKAIEAKNYKQAALAFEKFIAIEGSNVYEGRQKYVLNAYLYAGFCFTKANISDKVIPNYQKGIEWARKLNDDETLSLLSGNIGLEYARIGKFDEAIAAYNEALKLDKKNQQWQALAITYSNLGLAYQQWGDYEKALLHFQKSRDIHAQLKDEYRAALRDQSIGEIYHAWGEFDRAYEILSTSMAIQKYAGGTPSDLLITMADIQIARGEFKDAENKIKEAIGYDQQNEDESKLAAHLNELGFLYQNIDEDYLAVGTYEEALAYARFHEEKDVASDILTNMGKFHLKKRDYNQAIKRFEESIAIKEELRKNAFGPIRREFLSSQIETYKLLANSYFKTSNYLKTFEILEKSRGKYLAEEMGHTQQVKISTLADAQSFLTKDDVILVYANAGWRDKILLTITRDAIRGYPINDTNFLRAVIRLSQKHTVAEINNQRGFLKVVEKKKPEPQAQKEEEYTVHDQKQDIFELSINLYRYYLTNQMDVSELSSLFYDLLIRPAAGDIKKKKNLIVIPDGLLNYLPFESLQNQFGTYLIEDYNVKYVQSAGILAFLKSRDYPDSRKFMLAFGGAVYNQETYRKDMKITQAGYLPGEDFTAPFGLISISDPIYAGIPIAAQTNFNSIASKVDQAGDGSMRKTYKDIGVGAMNNLPGTLAEVKAIQQLDLEVKVYTGYEASEYNLKLENESGQLANYKVIHLATHGLTVPVVPELSAVVMSIFEPERVGDGYLRTDEISQLNIKADFVNLSACETGLGKIYGGEGVVGLTQSFLIAGANGLSVSLWSVADNSTSVFMVEMYKNVLNNNMTYYEAMAEVKRNFINGKYNKAWKNPFFWAPFVYYGR